MANSFLDKTGLAYFWSKVKAYLMRRNLVPEQSKTYTGVIGTANTWAGATFFYGSIYPTSWYAIWKIRYRIRVYVPGVNGYDQVAEVTISGDQGALRSYASFNSISSYYDAYCNELYRLKSAGYTNGYGHSLGVRLYSSYNPTNTSYKRTIEIDILETENCEFTFYDSCLAYTNIPGTGSTNYDTYTELNFTSNGLQETGDANDVNYQNRIYYSSSKAAEVTYRYQLMLRAMDGKLIPVSSANNTFTIGKTYSGLRFDPFGEIYYYNTTSTIAADGNFGNAILYRQIIADLRYAFDLNATDDYKLTARLPVYLTATPQSDGSAILTKTAGSVIGPLSQSLPTSEDGLIYIYLGQAYEDTKPYKIELLMNHPIYWYKDGRVQEYVKSEASTSVAGLMSASDKTKLNKLLFDSNDKIDSTILPSGSTSYTATTPITITNSVISHDTSGVTAKSAGDTSNQTPGFGDTFKALSGTVNDMGHLTALNDHTVTIPDAVATQNSAGLMSDLDKTKLDKIGIYYANDKNMTLAASDIDTMTAGASITIPKGVYVIIASWNFGTRTTSGTTNSTVCIRNGSNAAISQTRVFAATNNWNRLETSAIVEVSASTETFKVTAATTRPYTAAQNTRISAIRIA